MDVDRETMVELGVPIVAIIVFVVLIGIVGSMYNGAELEAGGAFGLIGVLVVFILGMAVVGIALGRMRSE